MLAQKETAAHSDKQAAFRNESHNKPYQDCALPSRAKLKNQLGELLLYPQASLSKNRRKEYWAQFESTLRRYLDLKICGRTL